MTVFESKTEWFGFHFRFSKIIFLTKAFIEEKICTLSSDAALKIMEIVINARVIFLSVKELLSLSYRNTGRKAQPSTKMYKTYRKSSSFIFGIGQWVINEETRY